MDTNQLVTAVLNLLLGGGGIVGAYFAYRGLKAKHRGVSTVEPIATVEAAQARETENLNAYWRRELRRREAEVDRVREQHHKELTRLRQEMEERARADALRIDELEEHIWERLPPPPPRRKGKEIVENG